MADYDASMPKPALAEVDRPGATVPETGFLRQVWRDAPFGIARLSPEGCFLDVNPRLCNLLGSAAPDLIGSRLFDLGPMEEMAPTRELLAALQHGEIECGTLERRWRRPAGEDIWLRIGLHRADGARGGEIVAMFEDIGGDRAREARFAGERVQHAQDLRRLTQADRENRERAGELRGLLVQVSESTLRQVGEELHDDVGQVLTGAAMLAGTIALGLAQRGQAEAPATRQLADLLNDAVGKLRAVTRGLFPIGLETAGLRAMLDALAMQLRASSALVVEFRHDGSTPALSDERALQIYRIVQEATGNALRHSAAKRLRLSFESRPGALSVVVADDGFGIERDRRQRGGIGLRTMRARAERIGASLRIHTPAEGGTRVELELPLAPSPPATTATP